MAEKWSSEEIGKLKEMVAERKAPAEIAKALGRPIMGTVSKMGDLGLLRGARASQAVPQPQPAAMKSDTVHVAAYAIHDAATLKRMQSVAKVCQQATVSLPAEVAAFYKVSVREPQKVDLQHAPQLELVVRAQWNADGSLQGYVVELPDVDIKELLIVVNPIRKAVCAGEQEPAHA